MIIIGTGAGGGTLARHLAPSGKRILLLERGDWLPARAGELARARRLRRQPLRLRGHLVRRRAASRSSRRSTTSSAARPSSTAPRSTACARRTSASCSHHDGISPAWPISYDELEPYYTQAEQLYQVHGARGEDPTEPPASAPYPFPAVSHEPRIQQLSDDLAAAGLPPVPRAVRRSCSNEANMPYSRCVRCATCDGFPCLVHAKSDAEVLGVRPALEHPNVTLLTNAKAVRLETNAAGTAVTEVVVERDGEHESAIAADIVVVSCGAANSAKLLLASASDKHPNGLANGSDQVGRNYMFHNSQAVLALSQRGEPDRLPEDARPQRLLLRQPTTSSTRSGNIQMVGKSQAPMFRGEKPLRDEARAGVDARARSPATRSTSGSRPRTCRGPRTGSPSTRDGNITLSLHGDATTSRRSGSTSKLKSMLGQLGMHPDHLHPPLRVHEERDPGRRRARTRPAPAASAPTRRPRCSNADCRAHELDNLYVVDTSFFPSIGAVNPALTAMANALRVGDHLLERLAVAPARPLG